MRIWNGGHRIPQPAIQLDQAERTWLFVLCRNWIERPGPASWGGPTAEQIELLLVGVSLYQLYWQAHEDGRPLSVDYEDVPAF